MLFIWFPSNGVCESRSRWKSGGFIDSNLYEKLLAVTQHKVLVETAEAIEKILKAIKDIREFKEKNKVEKVVVFKLRLIHQIKTTDLPAWCSRDSCQLTEAMSVLNVFLKMKGKKCMNCERVNPKFSKPTFGWFHVSGISSDEIRSNSIRNGGCEDKASSEVEAFMLMASICWIAASGLSNG